MNAILALISQRSAEDYRALSRQLQASLDKAEGPPVQRFGAGFNLAQAASWYGDRVEFDATMALLMADDARRIVAPTWVFFHQTVAVLEGDLPRSVVELDNVDRRHERVDPATFLWHECANRCVSAWLTNSPDYCRSTLDHAISTLGGPYFRYWNAWLHARSGDIDTARDLLSQMTVDKLARTYETPGSVGIAVPVTLATVEAQQQGPLEIAFEWLRTVPHLIAGGNSFTGPANRWCLGLVAAAIGEHDEAATAFEQAHELHRKFDTKTYLALGLIDHAHLTLTTRDLARTEQLLAEADQIITNTNMASIAARRDAVEAELRN